MHSTLSLSLSLSVCIPLAADTDRHLLCSVCFHLSTSAAAAAAAAAGGQEFLAQMHQSILESKHNQQQQQQQHDHDAAIAAAAAAGDHDDDEETETEMAQLAWPAMCDVLTETKLLWRISGPVIITGLLLYSRAMVSMLFLGRLGKLELAGGSLSLGFANITGYSVISGLAMGMEPICAQAFGARRWRLMGATLQRTVLMLLATSVPIAVLWLNMERLLVRCGQDPEIALTAGVYILYSLPDLAVQALLHPLRIFLRTQNLTRPLALAAGTSMLLHVPINLLMESLGMGIGGVALGSAWTNLNMVIAVSAYAAASGSCRRTWPGVVGVRDLLRLREFGTLLRLAVPSCVSVCLEWWWYEIMILLCGLLPNPSATVAAMGVLIQNTSLLYIFPTALSSGASTRVGNELGANRPRHARTASLVALLWASVTGVAGMAFAVSVRHSWGKLFSSDSDVVALAATALPVVGLCELGNSPQTTGCGVLRGSARPRIGAQINLGSFYAVGMPVAVLLAFVLRVGFVGLWLGLLAAQATCVVLMIYHLFRTDWMLEAHKATLLTFTDSSVEVANDDEEEEKQQRQPLVDSLA